MKSKGYVKCDLGYWEIQEEDGYIIAVDFVGPRVDAFEVNKNEGTVSKGNQLISEAEKQLEEYFNGSRRDFLLPIFLEGTIFQKKVWRTLQEIPYGKTKAYQEVAIMVGNKNSARAVGAANHKNPISIIIPCHRVIGKNGSLVGYGGGLDVKEFLLKMEEKFLYT